MLLDIQSSITDQQSVLKDATDPTQAEPGIGRLTIRHSFVDSTRVSASPLTSSSSLPLGNSDTKGA
jgi:hypothetical protein